MVVKETEKNKTTTKICKKIIKKPATFKEKLTDFFAYLLKTLKARR